jgi:hypothetical protein
MTCRALLFGLAALLLVSTTPLRRAHAQQPAGAPIVVGAYTCYVGEHAGIDDADARTVADILCGELGQAKAAEGIYDVRLGKLGTRVLLSLNQRAMGTSRRVLLQGFDEVPVASRRLALALREVSVEATRDVDNVVSSESRVPKSRALATTVDLGLVGVSAVGVAPNASAGVYGGITFRNQRLSMGGHVRGGGAGSGSNKLGFLGLDVGARYYLGDGETAPFFGSGVSFSYMMVNRDPVRGSENGYYGWSGDVDLSPSGSGFGAYLEGGLELLRSSRSGAAVGLRGDAPFYLLTKDAELGSTTHEHVHVSRYVVPISLELGFRFH